MLGLGLLSGPDASGKNENEVQGVQCTFNDRVMQVLLETGHLRKVLEDEDAGKNCMSMEYAHLLANLLSCNAASTNLKACVCRLIIADQDVGQKGQSIVLARGLAQLLQKGSSFLLTYASAAMVNLCQDHEVVRSHLIHDDFIPLLVHNDTDLMLYSFMLLVQLTKRSNHRVSLEKYGILQLCFDVLEAIHKQSSSVRGRVLAELCLVLGQLFCDGLSGLNQTARSAVAFSVSWMMSCRKAFWNPASKPRPKHSLHCTRFVLPSMSEMRSPKAAF
eukprot:g6730.t1